MTVKMSLDRSKRVNLFRSILLDIIVYKWFEGVMNVENNDMVYFLSLCSQLKKHMITTDHDTIDLRIHHSCTFPYSSGEIFSYQVMSFCKSLVMELLKEFFRFFWIVWYDEAWPFTVLKDLHYFGDGIWFLNSDFILVLGRESMVIFFSWGWKEV